MLASPRLNLDIFFQISKQARQSADAFDKKTTQHKHWQHLQPDHLAKKLPIVLLNVV
jgi:hypothetical protein